MYDDVCSFPFGGQRYHAHQLAYVGLPPWPCSWFRRGGGCRGNGKKFVLQIPFRPMCGRLQGVQRRVDDDARPAAGTCNESSKQLSGCPPHDVCSIWRADGVASAARSTAASTIGTAVPIPWRFAFAITGDSATIAWQLRAFCNSTRSASN